MEENNKTDLGIAQNIEGALCYSVGFLTGIIFLVLENNKFVKFHALQSIIAFLPLFIILLIFGGLPMFGMLMPMMWWPTVVPIIYFLELILWVLLMYKAINGEMYKLPIVGDFVERQLNNI